jgi:UDP-2-acetamido-3-amino-2,3-dideoxy-glucuronate N-acetyltransferase
LWILGGALASLRATDGDGTLPGDEFSSHETAVVEPQASIGRGTRVWHHAHIRTGALIGEECTIGKNVFVDAGASVGSRVKIENNVSVYRGVTIEDEVLVGPSAVFTNDLYPRAVAPEWEVVPTVVRRGATIGANATIVCGNDVGRWATVGAGAVVVRPVEDHELVVGNPARRAGWVCTCGRVAARTPERPDDVRCDECRRAGHPPA